MTEEFLQKAVQSDDTKSTDLDHLYETIYDHGAGKYQGDYSSHQRQLAFEIIYTLRNKHPSVIEQPVPHVIKTDALAAMTSDRDSWQRQCSDRVDDAVRFAAEAKVLKEELAVFRKAAQAVLDRWNSSTWQWIKQGPTGDVMATLQSVIDQSTTQPK